MSFAINQNFDLKSRVKDFTRQNLTLDDLPVTRDADYPDDYMVAIDGKIYIFNSNNSVDPTTGKWREFKSGVQTLPTASSSVLGCIKIGYTENDRNYPVELNSDGQAYVNVPWQDLNTTYSTATSTTAGLVKIGFAESGKDYPVELNSSGQMFVNVPWTDTGTTDTAITEEQINDICV